MRTVALLVACALAVPVFADHSRRLPAQKIATPPTIDGTIGAEEWAGIAPTAGFVNQSDDSPDRYGTTVWAAYDAKAVYLAFRLDDPDPKAIRRVEYRRGANVEGDDMVMFGFNPFRTFQEDEFTVFQVGAGGGLDVDWAGGRAAKREWQGEWDAKVRVTDKGWEVEAIIPWRVLQLPPAGVRDIEINFARSVPRSQTTLLWSNIGSDDRYEKNGVWTGVEIPQSGEANTIQVLPYQILGTGKTDGTEFNTGLDARYQAGSRLTGLMSVNPDFKNIENAVLGLEYSRFERLADERRPFFVEGGDYLQWGGMSAKMFAPQRIRTFDVGAKAFGKLADDQTFGALVTTRFDRETALAARYERTFKAGNLVRFGVARLEDKVSGLRNTAAGIDAFVQGERWGGDVILGHTDDSTRGPGRRFDADLTYRQRYLNGYLGWQEISGGFLPRLGFAPRTGFRGLNGGLFYEREFTQGTVSEVDAGINVSDLRNEKGGGVFQRMVESFLSVGTRTGPHMSASVTQAEYANGFDRFYSAELTYPNNSPTRRIELAATVGTVGGRRFVAYGLGGNYRFANRLTFSSGLEWQRIGSDREHQFVFNLGYEIDKYRSVSGRTIVRDGGTNWYLAFRQSGNLGAEYFLIVGDPNANAFRRRIVAKVVVPVEFGGRRR
ncbi:MAG: hypothetical protein KIS66_10350 [Fimbriimonadaceae bacterium]|nr:hypothetical protein [Fimbriimonadaceae bacterium]